MQGDNNNNTPANAANARRCKVPVIVLPSGAALAYKAGAPELPRLTAHVETDSSVGGEKQLCEIYIGDDVLAKGVIYRGKHVAVKMIRGALKGAMSRLGKRRRLTANRAARKAAANEEESK